MRQGNMAGRRRARGAAVVAALAALAAAGSATAGLTAAAPAQAAPEEGQCRVARLAEPAGFRNGSVMDIERLDGRVAYYGSSQRRGTQRAFVWRGRRAEPVRVGPRGFDVDIALELTQSGLVNGISENRDGSHAAWVQDLATGELTFFDTDSGPRGSDHGYAWIRRINATGAAVGEVAHSDSEDGEPGYEAVGFDSPDSTMTALPGSLEAEAAGAFGINDAGDRAGYLGTEFLPEDPTWLIFDPTVWMADGSVVELAHGKGGLDGLVRAVKNDGTASGLAFFGSSNPDEAHIEAAYWPTHDTIVGLGLLRGGGYSDVFGMDEGGWLVGMMDRLAPESRFGRDGFVAYSFLRKAGDAANTVRVMPSLYGARRDLRWKQWAGSAMHAVNADLDQAGTATHWKFDRRDRMLMAPTVFLNASRCGRQVPTIHRPFWELGQRPTARSLRPTPEQLRAAALARR